MDLTPVKLVVTDMDGTLLNSSHQVSSRFFELFEALRKRGIQFAAASGRQYESIAVKLTPILDQLIVIAENGGLVRHQGRELLSTPLDPNLRDQVLERLESVFRKLDKSGLKLNAAKCTFFKKKINYLGHVVSEEGIETDEP